MMIDYTESPLTSSSNSIIETAFWLQKKIFYSRSKI